MGIAKLAIPDFIQNCQTMLIFTWQAALQAQAVGGGGKGWLEPSGAAGTGSEPLQPGQGERALWDQCSASHPLRWVALPSRPGGAASPQRCCL